MTNLGSIVCLDVDYRCDYAVAAAVAFNNWSDEVADEEQTVVISGVEEYVPGQFYRRELPCLLAVLHQLSQTPQLIIVDSYAWLGTGVPGLGARLHEAMNRQIPVIGVAKTRFHSADAIEVIRGGSHSPLFVSAIGYDPQVAATNVQKMHGPYRIPSLLKHVDLLCRTKHVAAEP